MKTEKEKAKDVQNACYDVRVVSLAINLLRCIPLFDYEHFRTIVLDDFVYRTAKKYDIKHEKIRKVLKLNETSEDILDHLP